MKCLSWSYKHAGCRMQMRILYTSCISYFCLAGTVAQTVTLYYLHLCLFHVKRKKNNCKITRPFNNLIWRWRLYSTVNSFFIASFNNYFWSALDIGLLCYYKQGRWHSSCDDALPPLLKMPQRSGTGEEDGEERQWQSKGRKHTAKRATILLI